ncbi:MAG: hypothetical protein KME15_13405 [Drouetiella hepatica Uher 2000/2452]|uniref:Uncharacterized protein n=1 Tax=Drouetiella hepatica Uher 2000/2452 TaxID=904376 RepID=A0A951QAE5_9CYAN|nr:hypothetical protein [Drouetiella hepatica Uher 2000/2452]
MLQTKELAPIKDILISPEIDNAIAAPPSSQDIASDTANYRQLGHRLHKNSPHLGRPLGRDFLPKGARSVRIDHATAAPQLSLLRCSADLIFCLTFFS